MLQLPKSLEEWEQLYPLNESLKDVILGLQQQVADPATLQFRQSPIEDKASKRSFLEKYVEARQQMIAERDLPYE